MGTAVVMAMALVSAMATVTGKATVIAILRARVTLLLPWTETAMATTMVKADLLHCGDGGWWQQWHAGVADVGGNCLVAGVDKKGAKTNHPWLF